jgi:hypothetical protein
VEKKSQILKQKLSFLKSRSARALGLWYISYKIFSTTDSNHFSLTKRRLHFRLALILLSQLSCMPALSQISVPVLIAVPIFELDIKLPASNPILLITKASATIASSLRVEIISHVKSSSRVGDTLIYRYLVKNSGASTLREKILIADDHVVVECPIVPREGLLPNGTLVCEGTYLITPADVRLGRVTNSFAALSGKTVSPIDKLTVTINQDSLAERETAFAIINQDKTCDRIIGIVFLDGNGDGVRDAGESGLSGARFTTIDGSAFYSDKHGNIRVPCKQFALRSAQSGFILKLDMRSVPTGYQLVAQVPQNLTLPLGADAEILYPLSLQSQVHLRLNNEAFEPDSIELMPRWQNSIDRLIEILEKKPSILRVTYFSGLESHSNAKKRMSAIELLINNRWQMTEPTYTLPIETTIVGNSK